MVTREITDEQAGEIAEQLQGLEIAIQDIGSNHLYGQAVDALSEIRRLLGFPA
jgi:hypothetical protein